MKIKGCFAVIVCSMLMLTSCASGHISKGAASSEGNTYSAESSQNVESIEPSSHSQLSDEAVSSEYSIEDSSQNRSDDNAEDSMEDSSDEISEPSESSTVVEIIEAPSCSTAVLYCVEDGSFLYDDNSEKRIAPASITKLLTAAVLLRQMNPDDIVTVGTELSLVNEGSSVCWLSEGNILTVRDLITGMLLNSGNDAAYTAAVSAARKAYPEKELSDEEAVSVFCGMMNELAGEIGMSDSHFSDPDGWDDAEHYVTSADLVRLSAYVLQDPVIREITGLHQKYVEFVSGESVTWTNTNSLLDPDSSFYCDEAIGLKTGTTDNAGCCLAAAFIKNGKTYITVVSGCGESDDRYELTLKLLALADGAAQAA